MLKLKVVFWVEDAVGGIEALGTALYLAGIGDNRNPGITCTM